MCVMGRAFMLFMRWQDRAYDHGNAFYAAYLRRSRYRSDCESTCLCLHLWRWWFLKSFVHQWEGEPDVGEAKERAGNYA